ncbi:MAG: MFS transporter [Pseudomonadales bacterium]|nr:MFS transporter [Pseudomonadales bacterium]
MTPHQTSQNTQLDSAASHYALAVLLLAYILSFIDRNVLSLLVGPIREAFNITDFQFSLLHGLAFTLFYIFLGLPVGWLADRISRKKIIISGVFFWSLMTCLCGYAKNFTTLFATRIGVGIGEATLSPAAYSLLADSYSAKNLKWATSIFAMGITIGSGTSYIVGGWLYDLFTQSDYSHLPLIGNMQPWQLTFVAVGVPGLIVVALLLLIREPKRIQETTPSPTMNNNPLPIKQVAQFILREWRAYGSIMFSVSMMAIVGYGTLIWYPEFLVRTYQMSKSDAGAMLGSIFIFAGTAGTFSGAWFSSYLHKLGFADANMRVVLFAATICCIPATAAPLMNSSFWALALATLVIFVHYTHFGVAMAALQNITPNRMRAQVSALLLFVANFFGLALGGSIVASLTDFVFQGDQHLRFSLASISIVFYPLAALFVWLGLKNIREKLDHDMRPN